MTDLVEIIQAAALELVAETGDRDLTLLSARLHWGADGVQVQAVCRAEPHAEAVLTRETDGSASVLVEYDGRERVRRADTIAEAYRAAWAALGVVTPPEDDDRADDRADQRRDDAAEVTRG